MVLDSKLRYDYHLGTLFPEVRKTTGFVPKLNRILPRASLVSIFKTFVRAHFDYGAVLYDQAFNSAFQDKLESVQYYACLAITGAIRATLR